MVAERVREIVVLREVRQYLAAAAERRLLRKVDALLAMKRKRQDRVNANRRARADKKRG